MKKQETAFEAFFVFCSLSATEFFVLFVNDVETRAMVGVMAFECTCILISVK